MGEELDLQLETPLVRRCSGSDLDWGVSQMQASLHVYSLVVKRRIFDHLPMLVHQGMVVSVSQKFQQVVFEKLGQASHLAPLMKPDPAFETRREQLQLRLSHFESALEEIRQIM